MKVPKPPKTKMPKAWKLKLPLWFYRILPPLWEKNLTVLLYGPRSQGKSLHQAKMARQIFGYLDLLYGEFPLLPQAIICSNQLFTETFAEPYLHECIVTKGKKTVTMSRRLYYWESITQLKTCPREHCWTGEEPHVLHDAYILFDDIATIIPADGWADLPKWFRKIFAQAGHNDVHCIANIQDPVSCDINFRRYVDVALKFRKLFGNRRPSVSKPKVKYVWGVYFTRKIAAEELWRHGDMSETEIAMLKKENPELQKHNWNITPHWIGKKLTQIYDTLQNVPEYMPGKLEHIEMTCTNPNCGHIHVKHRPI